MRVLFRHMLPVILLTSCAHSNEPNLHAPQHLEYVLKSMEGHEAALQRDKDLLGAANLKDTTLTVYSYWNGAIEWKVLNIGDCLRYKNMPEGPFEILHRCTEVVNVDGVENEYAPYILAGKNFTEVIVPKISKITKIEDYKEISMVDINGIEIAKFRFKGAKT